MENKDFLALILLTLVGVTLLFFFATFAGAEKAFGQFFGDSFSFGFLWLLFCSICVASLYLFLNTVKNRKVRKELKMLERKEKALIKEKEKQEEILAFQRNRIATTCAYLGKKDLDEEIIEVQRRLAESN